MPRRNYQKNSKGFSNKSYYDKRINHKHIRNDDYVKEREF